MLDAMYSMWKGDDAFGEDPSVNKLEANTIWMGPTVLVWRNYDNQIAYCHTQPGSEWYAKTRANAYIYEGGGNYFNSTSNKVGRRW
jgi:threonine aldolase